MSENKNMLTLISANKLTIKFPDKNEHITDAEAAKTRDLVAKKGAYTVEGGAYLRKDALPHLLATDGRGVNRIYNELDQEDKLEVGQEKFVSIPAINKEISKRIQEPRDTLEKERLRDSEGCINALRDAPELEKYREVEESRNRHEQPLLKEKKIRAESITACQLTGAPLQSDAHAHHVERKADKPRKARDLGNIIIANPSAHGEVHREGAESREELSALCEKKGWKDPFSK